MNYNNIICFGDSLTNGARSYGCYPVYLADMLNKNTQYRWRTINRSVNGYTARDLWFKVNWELEVLSDVYVCCVLIGTNDCTNNSDNSVFKMYLEQIIDALIIKKIKIIIIGEIPPIINNGHPFFEKNTLKKRDELNKIIRETAGSNNKLRIVQFDLDKSCYEDSVHFNEKGNVEVAKSFYNCLISI